MFSEQVKGMSSPLSYLLKRTAFIKSEKMNVDIFNLIKLCVDSGYPGLNQLDNYINRYGWREVFMLLGYTTDPNIMIIPELNEIPDDLRFVKLYEKFSHSAAITKLVQYIEVEIYPYRFHRNPDIVEAIFKHFRRFLKRIDRKALFEVAPFLKKLLMAYLATCILRIFVFSSNRKEEVP